MKPAIMLLSIMVWVSCTSVKPLTETQGIDQMYAPSDPPITQSLFNDASATISEENIQKILDGTYALPQELRISLVKLESTQSRRGYYWNNEQYLKAQQVYLDLLTDILKQSDRTKKVSIIPDILMSSNPTFTSIREAAVRTQSDVVVIYSINSDIYSKYRLFSRLDIKAFATTQLILLDVRTGLIPFTTIVTKDYQSQRVKEELNDNEATDRIKDQAILLTIEEIGEQLRVFLRESK